MSYAIVFSLLPKTFKDSSAFLGSSTIESWRCAHFCLTLFMVCLRGVKLYHVFFEYILSLVLMMYHGGVLLISGYQADNARILK
ncbi:uncharacterized protein LACBIDRAFT_303126 [Laccaria bicolor S238N-H82]|uniref:Predicted protein n=1 Tax=Laccaria bicolor (strain S238N-H82 / ATCC MYA-4686) TaxID=486041 RepID=B0DIZ6_LACBS|nr:uncharacterized protein LACBIDRAFT_303126 [Laccaria bicolor S238N-H82]EDR05318.1 predicted protein [Laccaria bicolor S238N-H82]|eukprot:XP_001883876.1 predicted protein [Laccaria bicolor S238N-H82]